MYFNSFARGSVGAIGYWFCGFPSRRETSSDPILRTGIELIKVDISRLMKSADVSELEKDFQRLKGNFSIREESLKRSKKILPLKRTFCL